ncbi:hypothetical protein [Nocardia sp. NPDC050710]|uniref:hypothetical protein n=1 Tax=Nocardia sp. NPDC050710 TaxID=3157220 RepID=UPI0034117B77
MSTKHFTLPDDDGRPQEQGWFAVTGQAAHDAVSLHIVGELEEHRSAVHADGLVFGMVRARAGEGPHVWVNTRDGRRVHASPLMAS